MWPSRAGVLVCGSEPLTGRVMAGLSETRHRARAITEQELVALKLASDRILILADPPSPGRLIAALAERRMGLKPRVRRKGERIILMHGPEAPPELPTLGPDASLSIETFDIAIRGVGALLTRWPLHAAMDPPFGQRPHLLVAGSAPPAKTYIVEALRLLHYADRRPKITWLVEDPRAIELGFLAEFPQAPEIADLSFAALDAPDLGAAPKVTLAFVSRDDPVEGGLDTAETVARAIAQAQHASPPILLEVGDLAPGGRVADWDGQILPVSHLREACRGDVLLEGAGDAIARAIHEHYCDTIAARGRDPSREPAGQPWERLAESYRQANRHQADHLWAKLAVTDCQAVAEEMVESFAFRPLEVERLAAVEHRRWAADRYLDGWTHAPERDNARKHHPQLVPYADLSGPMKDLDRFAVRGVPSLLARSGLGVVRMLIVGIPEPAPGADLGTRAAKKVERVLRRLLSRYPDRVLILATTLEHADARYIVRTALERTEAGLFWLLPETVAALMGRQPSQAARTDVLDLGSRATRRILVDGPEELGLWLAARAEIILDLGESRSPTGSGKLIEMASGGAVPRWSFEY